MRRALTILKYLPAVLCGLLVVAWVVSFNRTMAVQSPLRGGGVDIGLCRGSVGWLYSNYSESRFRAYAYPSRDDSPWLGVLQMPQSIGREESYQIDSFLPIPFLLTLLLPLAIGPFIRFRYPLWSWFAFTALVAVELAYYLR